MFPSLLAVISTDVWGGDDAISAQVEGAQVEFLGIIHPSSVLFSVAAFVNFVVHGSQASR